MNAIVTFLRRNRWRLALVIAIVLAVALFYALGLNRYLSLAELHRQETSIRHMYTLHPALWILTYFAVYVAITGLSLPLSIPITLLAGPIFGLMWGSVIVTIAATIGATLAFWAARYLFRDWAQARFARPFASINRGIERDGIFYLFLLRLIPAFPFFAINLAMGLTKMRTWRYFLISLVGMIPGTVLYVNAGVQLGKIRSVHGLLSPTLIASLVAIGLFPLIVKKSVDLWRRRHPHQEPPSNSPFPPDGGKGEN
jgi:uncharacterized membrane protein YdjX (TVP38/TMEM64 family)